MDVASQIYVLLHCMLIGAKNTLHISKIKKKILELLS